LKNNVLQVSHLRTQKVGGVEKIKSDGLAVGRNRSDHARLISCVTIMGHEQATAVEMKHSYLIVGPSTPVISSMSAEPMEVTPSETCGGLPSMVPSREPVRVFSLSKDFCASDWAKATVERHQSTRRRDFMFILLKLLYFRVRVFARSPLINPW